VSHSPLDVAGLRERVHKRLEAFVSDRLDVLATVAPDTLALAEATLDLLRGGKRLRAAFCYWGWRGAGGEDGEEIVAAAAAMELFQAAALIHDDVMDGSDTRRGKPAVHRRFAGLHAEGGWDGDAERFGAAGAVLAGDLCLVWSDEMFTACGLEPDVLHRGRVPFDRMRTQLMAGQYLDMLEQAHPSSGAAATDRARQVIRFKSAKYTIEEPLQIGGCLAGADAELLAGYRDYALPLGEAFQLRDDVLGVFGDPERTGKPAGDDLREGKRTVLIAEALRHADLTQTADVRRLLGDPHLDAAGVRRLREIVVDTGALGTVEELIDVLVARSRSALAALPGLGVDAVAHQVLADLVDAATARTQ
jgi:geranylgeranyl diphosphate synthase type I